MVTRRRFFLVLGAGALAPCPSFAQQQPKVWRVGFLSLDTSRSDAGQSALEQFPAALAKLGYREGKNLAMEYRYADGRPERLPVLAAELVQSKPDIILALGGDVVPSAQQATQSIPVVFSTSSDPVLAGLVVSLAHPGGNATGVTFILDELASKRLELLKEAAPRISRVGFLWNPEHPDNEYGIAQDAARKIGVELRPVRMRGTG